MIGSTEGGLFLISKWLLREKRRNVILRRGTIWNLYSSILNSGMTALIIFFITLFGSNPSIGYFSLATGIAYQCQAIGNFGMRNIQASDVKNEFSFFDYLNARFLPVILMYAVLCFYAFQSDYTLEKSMIILTYGIYRSIDALEDVFHGEFQRNDRFDIGVIFQSIRFTVSLVVLALVMFVTHNLILSFISASIISIFLFLVQNSRLIHYFVKEKYSFNPASWKMVFKMCFPICISGFIAMYIVNASKYAIDNYLSNDIQVYYGILVLPVTLISILSTVIYRPHITYISKAWYKKDFKTFKKIILKQLGIISGLTILIMIGGYLLGLSILGWIYQIDLTPFMLDFMLLLLGGGIYAVSQLIGIVVTILRKQNHMFMIYIFVFCIILLSAKWLAINLQMTGVVLIYVISVSLLAFLLIGVAVFYYLKESRNII